MSAVRQRSKIGIYEALTYLYRKCTGLYLQGCGERSAWFPARGQHHLFPGISFEFGRISFISALSGEADSVSLADDFGELSLVNGDGEVLRLVSSGRSSSATLIYPDGNFTERLRSNRYSTEIARHGVASYVERTSIGGATLDALPGGKIEVAGEVFDCCGGDAWKMRLPNGSTLTYRPHFHLVLSGRGPVRTFVYAAKEDRLLEVDYCRQELSFVYVTNESESPAQILDSVATVYPEDGSVQILHHSCYERGEAIDFYGPSGGLRILRDEGSDRLFAYQGQQLIGVAEYCPNSGYDFKSDRSFNRWRFSAGSYSSTPRGNGWYAPTTTAALLSIPLVVGASLLVSDTAAYALAFPVLGAAISVLAFKKFARIAGA